MNMSKFVAEDVPLFISLIDDLFPAQKADRAQFPDITAALEKVRTDHDADKRLNWFIGVFGNLKIGCCPDANKYQEMSDSSMA